MAKTPTTYRARRTIRPACPGAVGCTELLERHALFAITPNDPLFPLQTWLEQVSAPQAWELTTGNSAVVVNVNDTGIDYTHPDLYKNIWLNQAEIPFAVGGQGLRDADRDGLVTFWDLNSRNGGRLVNGAFVGDLNANGYIDGGDLLNDPRWENGIDDGGNGFADDLIGWNFDTDNNDPMDDAGHGSMVAGIIGMVADNAEGGTGVAWRVSLMATKLHRASPEPSDIAAGIRYAADNGARISNNSLTDRPDKKREALYSAALDYAGNKDVLAVFGAGNLTWDNDVRHKDQNAIASLDRPNILSVAAVTADDHLASFSNFGMTSVDLAAPGVDIGSTAPVTLFPEFPYILGSGTSFAAPHVAGAAALMLARKPDLSYSQLKDAILANVDPISALAGKTAAGGRLNVFKAVSAVSVLTGPTPAVFSATLVSASRDSEETADDLLGTPDALLA